MLILLLVFAGRRRKGPLPWVQILFFCSGFPALIYQIVWQRALFALYGINIQSVTIVVSAFMLGLGIGSLAGGALSENRRFSPVALFAVAELGTAAFGIWSLPLFRWIGEFTAGRSLFTTGLAAFLLIVLPTVLMGATLPLLVAHLVRTARNMGSSVGALYFANTLGSGIACFAAADVLMRQLGQSGSVRLAASVNAFVGLAALVVALRRKREDEDAAQPALVGAPEKQGTLLPFSLALLCTGFCGFAALGYEIIWYRLLAFALADTAPVFASLLGSYLLGLALGSRFMERYAERHRDLRACISALAVLLFASALAGFAAAPTFAFAAHFAAPLSNGAQPVFRFLLLTVCVGAFFFGASFPLIAHVSVDPAKHAGSRLSYLYAANIAGSVLGSFVVGFILMDYLSVWSITLLLLAGGIFIAVLVLMVNGGLTRVGKLRFSLFFAAALAVAFISRPIMPSIYDRLLFKNGYPGLHFQRVVEDRSGTIGVTPDAAVFGGGVYDGRFNVDLLHDTNMILRPYALAALHPAPRRVLMIGLGSGSWAQVVVNHPQVEELVAVEINPGYLKLIPDHPEVASLLKNPKVHIVIDDGRRWLMRNRDQRFDAVIMNTSFYWRNHISNLLSVEFLQLVRQHLNPGGILLYNTTGSDDVIATGLRVYPHGLRVLNALAVSDSPIVFDRARWAATLLQYSIDGRHVVDPNDPAQLAKLEQIVNTPDHAAGALTSTIENESELRQRLNGRLIITDDNMGLEWR